MVDTARVVWLSSKIEAAKARKAEIEREMPDILVSLRPEPTASQSAESERLRREMVGLMADLNTYERDLERLTGGSQSSGFSTPPSMFTPAAQAPAPPSGPPPAQQPPTPPAQEQPSRRRRLWNRIRRLFKWVIITLVVILIASFVIMALERSGHHAMSGVNGHIKNVTKSLSDGVNRSVELWDEFWVGKPKTTETPDSEECLASSEHACGHYTFRDLHGCDTLIVPSDKFGYVVFKREGDSEFSEAILPPGTYHVAYRVLDTESQYALIYDGAKETIEKHDGYISHTHSKVTAVFVRVDSSGQSDPFNAPDLGPLPSPAS